MRGSKKDEGRIGGGRKKTRSEGEIDRGGSEGVRNKSSNKGRKLVGIMGTCSMHEKSTQNEGNDGTKKEEK